VNNGNIIDITEMSLYSCIAQVSG